MKSIFAAYLSGATGNTFALLLFDGGLVAGADAGGGNYDGKYTVENGQMIGSITHRLPPDGASITGVSTGSEPLVIHVPVAFPVPIDAAPFHTVDTQIGKVNIRFEKLRDIP